MTNTNGYYIDSDENGFGSCFVLTGPWRNEFSQIMSSQGLSVLRLSSSAGWKDRDISFIVGLKFLVGVEVYSWDVKDVTPIFQNTGLRYVGIQSEFSSVANFQALKDLEVCKIFWRPKVSGLECCTNLRHLNIVNYPNENLTSITSLTKLERLQVSSRKILSLRGIESLSRLKIFDAANCPKLSDISWLMNCTALETIEFESCRQISEIPKALRLNDLQEVSLVDCGKIETLITLANCKNLRKLRFVGDTFIIDGELDFLLAHPSVRDVWYANRSHYSLTRESLEKQLQARE